MTADEECGMLGVTCAKVRQRSYDIRAIDKRDHVRVSTRPAVRSIAYAARPGRATQLHPALTIPAFLAASLHSLPLPTPLQAVAGRKAGLVHRGSRAAAEKTGQEWGSEPHWPRGAMSRSFEAAVLHSHCAFHSPRFTALPTAALTQQRNSLIHTQPERLTSAFFALPTIAH